MPYSTPDIPGTSVRHVDAVIIELQVRVEVVVRTATFRRLYA